MRHESSRSIIKSLRRTCAPPLKRRAERSVTQETWASASAELRGMFGEDAPMVFQQQRDSWLPL